MMYKRFAILLVLFFGLVTVTWAYQPTQDYEPRFVDNVHLIRARQFSAYSYFLDWELSEDGRKLTVSIGRLGATTDAIAPPVQLAFQEEPRQLLWQPVFAFSPDEQFLAIRRSRRLTILALPTFAFVDEIKRSMGGNRNIFDGELAWSADSQRLATIGGPSLLVWDATTQRVYEHENAVQGSIFPSADGWLIKRHFPQFRPNVPFVFCGHRQRQCVHYELPLPYPYQIDNVVFAPDGSYVFTEQSRGDGRPSATYERLWLWRRKSDGRYIPEVFSFADPNNRRIDQINTDGTIIASYQNRTLDYYAARQIWEFTPLQFAQHRATGCRQLFMPNEPRRFLELCDMVLIIQGIYGGPIDVIDIGDYLTFSSREGFDPNLPVPEGVYFDSTYRQIRGVTDDGRWVLVWFGSISALVPIDWGASA